MNKLEIAKTVTSFVVGTGVAKIVNDVIANNINDPEKVAAKVTTFAGAAVLGLMARDASKAYTSTKIDSCVTQFNELKTKMQEAKSGKHEAPVEQQ